MRPCVLQGPNKTDTLPPFQGSWHRSSHVHRRIHFFLTATPSHHSREDGRSCAVSVRAEVLGNSKENAKVVSANDLSFKTARIWEMKEML